MRIHKIEKLNYARYKNFSWNPLIQPFCDSINILFGWNGSGKTTLSRIFYKIEMGIDLEDCSFKIKTNPATIHETDAFDGFRSKIRVFNDDYVSCTLKSDAKIPYIFFAGKDAVDYLEEEMKLEEKKKELSKIILPDIHDKIAKDTAMLVKSVTGINSYKKELTGGGTYSSYDKTDFEKRFIDIQEKIRSGQINDSSSLILSDIDALKIQLINTDRIVKNRKDITNAANWIISNNEDINLLLESTPMQEFSQRIGALSKNQIDWIERGVSLHFCTDVKPIKCIFCNSDIKNSNELLKHFSQEVVSAIDKINLFIAQVETHTINLAKLEVPNQIQIKDAKKLRSIFDVIFLALQEKRNAVSISKKPIIINIEDLSNFNNITELDTTSIAYAIETHYVAEQYQIYNQACEDRKMICAARDSLQKEVKELDQKVRILKQKAKNTHEPAVALNTLLRVVFPYRKIEIIDNDDGTGYVLRRDGVNCLFSSLSEGEKNFIALSYFLYSLNDTQNKLADDGIVVIDDPVSSLDKQAIFQIFSIIATELKERSRRQYFIFTHNLDFLGHLKQFLAKKISRSEIRLMSFFATDSGCVIGDIDVLLKNYKSDYYYIFSVLYNFKDVCSFEDSYLVVNLLRRWLETFLEFKFSTVGDFQSTLESAYGKARIMTKTSITPFKENHLAMYRFVNHGSHGFSDIESIDESVLINAVSRIREAFELVKILDPMHFEKLEDLANKNDTF